MSKIKNRIDVRFLTETLAIQSYSKDDNDMLVYIKNKLAQINVTVQEDSYGNIYVTKGVTNDYPCLVAHVDTIHAPIKNYAIFKNDDTLFAFDNEKRKQCGIGGDDKVGVYILLQALLDVPVMKAVFFRNEEIGCLGSTHSILNHKDWYTNCNFIIEPDRKDYYDLITNAGGVKITNDEFLEEIKEISDKYEYKNTYGIVTDVSVLVENNVGISCLNISCGYINPHSATETVSIVGVNAAYNFIYDIVTEYSHRRFNYVLPVKTVCDSWRKDKNYYSSFFKSSKNKPGNEQLQLFGPEEFVDISKYGSSLIFDSFRFLGETKNKNKLYRYIGIKAIPFSVDAICTTCKDICTLYYMPYEGRIFCTKCNDFASNEEDLNLFKCLEIDDNNITFVFSVYADAWMDKQTSEWNDELKCWVPDNLPF